MSEQELVESFLTNSTNYDDFNVLHIERNSKSKHMDCEFTFNGEYIREEAKVFNDSRNNSQKFLSIFGGILKGRNLPLFDTNNTFPIVYAVLINEAQYEKFSDQKSKDIANDDWLEFGKDYEVKYIFTLDRSTGVISYIEWDSI